MMFRPKFTEGAKERTQSGHRLWNGNIKPILVYFSKSSLFPKWICKKCQISSNYGSKNKNIGNMNLSITTAHLIFLSSTTL